MSQPEHLNRCENITEQCSARQERRHCRTRHSITGQRRTVQGKAGQYKAGHDKAGQDSFRTTKDIVKEQLFHV